VVVEKVISAPVVGRRLSCCLTGVGRMTSITPSCCKRKLKSVFHPESVRFSELMESGLFDLKLTTFLAMDLGYLSP